MRRTRDYAEFELMDNDIGALLENCLSELSKMAETRETFGEPSQSPESEAIGIARNREYLKHWNPSKEELARWCTLLYSQWLLGKFEDDMGLDLESEKNAAVRKYLDARTPQIFAYIEAGCPGYGNR